MTAVSIADAARLLGKPERTIRWAARGRLPATRTADGWLVELELDEHGQVAATGGQLATVPVTYLQELQTRAESAAFWQGRASVLEARVQQLEGSLALPAPPERPQIGPPDNAPVEPTQNGIRKAQWPGLVAPVVVAPPKPRPAPPKPRPAPPRPRPPRPNS